MNTKDLAAIVVFARLIGTTHSAAGQCSYDVTLIEAPSCTSPPIISTAMHGGRMNELGWFSGGYDKCESESVVDAEHPILWAPELGLDVLPIPEGYPSGTALAVNDAGTVVGVLRDVPGPYQNIGAVWSDGVLTLLEPGRGGLYCEASAINGIGQIVGYREIASDDVDVPFFWEAGEFTMINPGRFIQGYASDISGSGHVVGHFGSMTSGGRGFSWQAGKTTILDPVAGGSGSQAEGINDHQAIVGSSVVPSRGPLPKVPQATLWENGTVVGLPNLPPFSGSHATAINNRGTVLGRCLLPREPQQFDWDPPVIWIDGKVIDLNPLMKVSTYCFIQTPHDINDTGQILCQGTWIIDDKTKSGLILLTPIDPPAADLNGDCRVDGADLGRLIECWGSDDVFADLNTDRVVDGADVGLLLGGWTPDSDPS
jgi:hypothetical protein